MLNDDQKMLQETAAAFLKEEGGPAKQLRHWREIGCKDGFGHALWREFAALGLSGLCIDPDLGGSGLGATEAAIVMQEIGRNLTPSPLLTTGVVAVQAIRGTEHEQRWAPAIVAGEAVLAVAVDDADEGDRAQLRCERQGNGFVLRGSSDFVVQGGSADMIVVSAQGPDGGEAKTLFAVAKDASGLTVDSRTLVDSSKAASMRFDNVMLDGGAVIGEVGEGADRIKAALAFGRVGASAEMAGVGTAAAAITLDYLRQRRQFGRVIGEFQALQHRAAHLFAMLEMARAVTFKAAALLDAGDPAAKLMISVAKAKTSTASRLAVQEAVQMHGGIGMTDEHDIGLFMKRQAVLSALFGDECFHRGRVAELSGY